jgi:hypothetical protein
MNEVDSLFQFFNLRGKKLAGFIPKIGAELSWLRRDFQPSPRDRLNRAAACRSGASSGIVTGRRPGDNIRTGPTSRTVPPPLNDYRNCLHLCLDITRPKRGSQH